ncbi:endonuclease VII domain-containing protein [Streptomyces nodosus]|uniref:endonuclease VII domain-containing protein n=1 Tax=Streptomyces nodosus TaxID=40318 RepID=UPI0034541AF3
MTKTCWGCKEEKSPGDFYQGQSRCKICSNKIRSSRHRMCFRGCACEPCKEQREKDRWYNRNRPTDQSQYPSQASTYRRAVRYRLTVEELEAMHVERDDRCDICGNREHVKGSTGKVKSLAVDHNSETGYVRGLLCSNCNRALGLLGHDPERILTALDHLLREHIK